MMISSDLQELYIILLKGKNNIITVEKTTNDCYKIEYSCYSAKDIDDRVAYGWGLEHCVNKLFLEEIYDW